MATASRQHESEAERLARLREKIRALGVPGDDGTLMADVDPTDEAAWTRLRILEEKRSAARVMIEARRLQSLGILDEHFRSTAPVFDADGRLIIENLPPDMRPGTGTDSTT